MYLDFERGVSGVAVTNEEARLLLQGSPARERSWPRRTTVVSSRSYRIWRAGDCPSHGWDCLGGELLVAYDARQQPGDLGGGEFLVVRDARQSASHVSVACGARSVRWIYTSSD